jgi:Transglutaminase-like superfamily
MSTALYFLSSDCFVCEAQDYWVILNARRDRYLCVTRSDLASIGPQLYGWSMGAVTASAPHSEAQKESLVESLISSGVITRRPNEGKPFVGCKYPPCERAADESSSMESAKINFLCVTRFLLACATIDRQLRTKPFDCTLARIERRRLRNASLGHNMSAARVLGLVAAFRRLRALYPRPYLCLFDSLALQEFLAKYKAFPYIVFGVTAEPFVAHCWLQDDAVVLNDDLERVGKFKPILNV